MDCNSFSVKRSFLGYSFDSCARICLIFHLNLITLAGTPPAIAYGGMFVVTHAHAPMSR